MSWTLFLAAMRHGFIGFRSEFYTGKHVSIYRDVLFCDTGSKIGQGSEKWKASREEVEE
ncbi:hypothetical protein D3C73_1024760 [compost metagenome]